MQGFSLKGLWGLARCSEHDLGDRTFEDARVVVAGAWILADSRSPVLSIQPTIYTY